MIFEDQEGRDLQIKNIITEIYTKLYGRNGLQDVDDIMCFFINEEINSEENLKGNNILKILANLAVAIHDYYQNAVLTFSQFAFGSKIRVGNTIIPENSLFFDAVEQIKTIREVFGIKSP